MQRRLAALLVLALALVAGLAAPAAAQVPGLAATLTVPLSTTVGVSVQATAVFTPPTTAGPLQVQIRLGGAAGTATLSNIVASSGLTNCTLLLAPQRALCDWPSGAGEQTLTVTINALAVTATDIAVFADGGPVGALAALDDSNFEILPATTPTTPTTPPTTPTTPPTTPTTPPATPTTPPTTPTTAPTTPTSAAVAPTSAATTDPGTLPATGASDTSAFIALVVLALGAFLLIIVRKFREA
jgi:LPXTG-motif cell wall-anchored protein